jgi:hypothetical protein
VGEVWDKTSRDCANFPELALKARGVGYEPLRSRMFNQRKRGGLLSVLWRFFNSHVVAFSALFFQITLGLHIHDLHQLDVIVKSGIRRSVRGIYRPFT